MLGERGITVNLLQPSNCGFDVGWTEHFRARFAGVPVKPVIASFTNTVGEESRVPGEFIVTNTGVEGGLVYALSARVD